MCQGRQHNVLLFDVNVHCLNIASDVLLTLLLPPSMASLVYI